MTDAEKVLLNEVRNASPEDCIIIAKALDAIPGQGLEDEELTPLGFLIGAINNELLVNGIMKMNYEK